VLVRRNWGEALSKLRAGKTEVTKVAVVSSCGSRTSVTNARAFETCDLAAAAAAPPATTTATATAGDGLKRVGVHL
jgi:hypothetical protein